MMTIRKISILTSILSILVSVPLCAKELDNKMNNSAAKAVTFKASFVENENKHVFDRGKAAEIIFSAHTTLLLNDSVSLKGTLTDYENKPLLTLEKTVKFNKKDETVIFKLPAKIINRNGIYRLNVIASHKGGKLGTYKLQFAVIDNRPMPKDFDPSSPYSATWISDYDVARRIGIRWARVTWYGRHIPRRKDGTFDFEWLDKYFAKSTPQKILQSGPICNPVIPDQRWESIERYVEEYVAMIKQAKERYGDAIVLVDLGNEPEGWTVSPPLQNEYFTIASAQKEITKRLHKQVPGVKIMNATSTHINMALLAQMASIGGPDAVDVVGVHGYRSPSAPEFVHDDDIRAIKSLFPGKPVWVNEQGYYATPPDYAPSYDDSTVSPTFTDEITQAIYLPRYWLSQLAGGYTRVNVFTPENVSFYNNLLYNRTHIRPGTAVIAALTKLLPHPKFIKRLTPKNCELWALQFESDGNTVTAIWSLRPRWSVKLPAGEVKQVQDIYGNVIEAKKKGGKLELIVGQAPVYVVGKLSKISDYKEYTGLVRPLPMLSEDRVPTGLTMKVLPKVDSLTSSQIRVLLTNNSKQKMSGTLKGKFNEKLGKGFRRIGYKKPLPKSWKLKPVKSDSFELAPGASTEVDFRIVSNPAQPFDPYKNGPGFVAHWHIYGYFFAFQAKLNDGRTFDKVTIEGMALRGVPELKNIKIDGNLDEWKDVPVFPDMHTRNTGLGKIWSGVADFKGDFKIAWCDKGLLFAADVTDDVHHQIYKGSEMWRCDSIDIGIDPEPEKLSFVDYHVFTTALYLKHTPTGDASRKRVPDKLQEYCYRRRATSKKPAGFVKPAQISIKRTKGDYSKNGKTLYEILIPWDELGVSNAAIGKRLGFSLMFNESDGWERRGWNGWFLPEGGQIVDSRNFGDITLVK